MSPSRRRASAAWEGRRTITVACLPGRGVYARHLSHPEGVDGVHRTTVALPGGPARETAFDPSWLRGRLAGVDVVHVQGVRPGADPEVVARAADLVRDSGTPLVYTGYHLSDPTGADPARYAAQLDALLPRTDAVVTLTAAAASEMTRRWGVRPLVLPHPHVVDFVRMRQPRGPRRARLRVGAHLGGLRLPIDPVALVTALTRAVHDSGAELDVHVHETVLDPGSSAYAPGAMREVSRLVRGIGGTLRLRRPMSDSQLWDHLFSVDVSVVPGLFGSHSIWPEACSDLGTRPLIPQGSHAVHQRACLTYRASDDLATLTASLTEALETAQSPQAAPRSDPEDRWAERVAVAEGLRHLYEDLLGLDTR